MDGEVEQLTVSLSLSFPICKIRFKKWPFLKFVRWVQWNKSQTEFDKKLNMKKVLCNSYSALYTGLLRTSWWVEGNNTVCCLFPVHQGLLQWNMGKKARTSNRPGYSDPALVCDCVHICHWWTGGDTDGEDDWKDSWEVSWGPSLGVPFLLIITYLYHGQGPWS